jgi:hypothetical protein
MLPVPEPEMDKIDYHALVQDALRQVVRRVLDQVAEHGLPGDHYFYIGFRTDAPGVQVPRSLRDRYPEEVTVVVQHQFWDLEIDDELFSITLAFNTSRQRLTVPFAALTAFADPSADFILRFEPAEEPEVEPAPAPVEKPPPSPTSSGKFGEVVQFDPNRRK